MDYVIIFLIGLLAGLVLGWLGYRRYGQKAEAVRVELKK